MNNCNDNTYNFKFSVSPEAAEKLKNFSCDNTEVKNKGIVLVRSIEEIKAAGISDLTSDEVIIKRMLELEIYPFTMTDQYGREYMAYMVDENGCYVGTKNKPKA